MTGSKILISILMVAVMVALPASSVYAAQLDQTETPTTITGTVGAIVVEKDTETAAVTVLVTLTDDLGETQTLRLSTATASEKGLITAALDGTFTAIEEMIGQKIVIDPATIIEDEEATPHPVATILAGFFGELLGVDYDTIMAYHQDGVGFGVIAQAGWMSKALNGDSTLFTQILDAKQSNDFSTIILPDGTTAANWGQLRKAVLDKTLKSPGAIISGRADHDQEDETDIEEPGTDETTIDDQETDQQATDEPVELESTDDKGNGHGDHGNGNGNNGNHGNGDKEGHRGGGKNHK